MEYHKLAIGFFAVTAMTASANLFAATAVGSNDGIVFTADLNTTSITHQLYQPSAKNIPHPFYKKYCKNVTSKNYKNAKGYAVLWFNPKTNVLQFALTYSGLSAAPIMMHFHLGKAGVGGPIVQTICGYPPPSNPKLGYSRAAIANKICPRGTSGFIFGSYKLRGNDKLKPAMTASAERKALMNNDLYLNIHTCLNEAGEVRGQINR